MKYSDYFMDTLVELGFTTCFFVAGGNVMHLLESARTRFQCIPTLHEVSSVIAAEYFNETNNQSKRAFALVTAGPGITNAITGIAGSWLENRQVLIVGGQAKVSDLARGKVRQIGHQEIDGRELVSSISKLSVRLETPISKKHITQYVSKSWKFKPGPVFLEVCLDVSSSSIDKVLLNEVVEKTTQDKIKKPSADNLAEINSLIETCTRPLVLIGGGVSRITASKVLQDLMNRKIPLATTFNGADRVPYNYKYYSGRPNWYGMRWANAIIQQSDLIFAVGTRLGIQQVGFNTKEFAPKARIIHIDADEAELNKGFPKTELKICADANEVIEYLSRNLDCRSNKFAEWLNHIEDIRLILDNPETQWNIAGKEYIELQSFLYDLSDLLSPDDQIIPCSSGGSFTGMMQMYRQTKNQKMITDKSLAAMGYGLAGAIGASFANTAVRTVLVEGDGGFSQNMQELGVVSAHQLNLKIFIMDNAGYSTIKNSQRRTFNGNYIGCDRDSMLNLPDWELISRAFNIKSQIIDGSNYSKLPKMIFESGDSPVIFVVKLDPNQDYFPKIVSQKIENNIVISNPLHKMEPPLESEIAKRVFKYI